MVVGEVLQAFPCSPSEKMSLQLTSYQYNGKIMQIDCSIKACHPGIHKLYKWGDYLYLPFFLPFTHLPQNLYKYQLLLPTKFTNRANIYILSFMGLCFLAHSIVVSKLITKFALFANQNAMAKYMNRLKVVLAEQHKTNLWLAKELGKDPATVSKWSTNTVQPSLETLTAIAECLHIDVRTLLNPNDSAITSEPELNYGEK